ncbi:protein TolR [Saccharibacter sp. 17.LH.SD]|uniref:protein TolR n=1 Tax=Saccharibacter sp. 17.LH.SD TaxID=2689393 RepID=UPI001369C1A3|nr:protein TolR [Saccharibacter sp. 17.LH.SD]MXV43985.1 protein TolR [Saccharibacter sp. 17.LH.SD]
MAVSRGNSRLRRRRRLASEINVTPLVDVMLVLLIIFMVTAPMLTSGINVDLPKTSAKPVNTDSKPITVSLRSDGSLFLGEDAVSDASLLDRLKQAAGNDTERRIFVRADAKLDYGQVMRVMGEITSGGFNHVALLAQQPQSGP